MYLTVASGLALIISSGKTKKEEKIATVHREQWSTVKFWPYWQCSWQNGAKTNPKGPQMIFLLFKKRAYALMHILEKIKMYVSGISEESHTLGNIWTVCITTKKIWTKFLPKSSARDCNCALIVIFGAIGKSPNRQVFLTKLIIFCNLRYLEVIGCKPAIKKDQDSKWLYTVNQTSYVHSHVKSMHHTCNWN